MGTLTQGTKLHGFEIIESRALPEINAVGVFARHEATGLEVFHLVNSDEENLFAYAFLTPPSDSTGVAHILEHSVLCGSKNYPLKDPFIVLAKQSVKTFLNAMTFPDKTVYPASSMVEADYFNLMSVYGDAVFFPLLDEATFRQEGHRFEFAEDGSVSIQGIVFNEMRGNYSSFDSIAGDWSLRSLLGGTPYDHDSGGDPADIPALTYKQFVQFHRTWYHPGNCRVFLCGNIPTEKQLALLQEQFLQHFGPRPAAVDFGSVRPFESPVEFDIPAPAGEQSDLSKVTVLLNWLLPDSTDTVSLMEANLVSEILLGHDGAPLSRALVESGLGEDIAPQSGLETELKHMCFTAGLRGVERDRVAEFEPLVRATIQSLIENGIPETDVETAVRSIDFSNREVRRSSGPFSLVLMRRSLRGWMHGFGPFSSLSYIPAFEQVKQKLASEPGYLSGLLESWFITNSHRSLVTVFPDPQYEKRLEDKLAARIRLFESGLDDSARQTLIAEQNEFFARQKETNSEELLSLIPHLSKEDLPPLADAIQSSVRFSGQVPLLVHDQPTNGIAYADIALPVDTLPARLYPLLPFFTTALTGCGLGPLGWAEASALSASLTGGLGAMLFTSSSVPGMTIEEPLPSAAGGRDYLILRVKMLGNLVQDALELAFRYLREADFSDTKRIRDLLLEYRNDLDSSLAPAGNQYALSRASCRTGRSKTVDEVWNGMSQISYIRSVCQGLKSKHKTAALIDALNEIRSILVSSGMIINLTSTPEINETMIGVLGELTAGFSAPVPADIARGSDLGDLDELVAEVSGNTADGRYLELVSSALQVGFAAAVIPAPPYGSDDLPVYSVFGQWLSHGALWEKIRTEGGAYGVFAYPDSLEAIFSFATYRDPSPLRSLEVFYEVLEGAAAKKIDPVQLERTITGCYSREIQPRSPADKGFTSFIRTLYGITDEARRKRIQRLVSVTPEDLQQCAEKMLADWPGYTGAVLAGKKQFKDHKGLVFAGNIVKYTI